MSTKKSIPKSNNEKLRNLIKDSGRSIEASLRVFNEGQVRPISLSGFKAWLSDPTSARWRPMADVYWEHAQKVITKPASDHGGATAKPEEGSTD